MRRRLLLAALPAVLLLSGCATHRAEGLFLTDDAAAPYTLAAGDRLRVIVFGQDNLSNVYAVDGAGRVSMPLIGAVPAQGLTTRQLERAVEERLRNGYLREPRVTIDIDAYRPFFVLGEVVNSGQFPYVSGMTVQTAVAIAGGFAPRARRDTADITRATGGDIVTGAVPITHPVRPGDTIVIRERWF